MVFKKGNTPWNKGLSAWNKGLTSKDDDRILSGERNGMYGRHHTKESKEKISQNKNRSLKISKKLIGRPKSQQHKKKLSESHKNRESSFKGKHHTEEIKQKISKSLMGRYIGDLNPARRPEVREKLSGENNPNFNNWSSRKPYCKLFSPRLKEEIRKRDNHICQNPKCNKIQNNIRHSIHHIHYDKENCYPDLITLCRKCNSLANSNRDYWEQLYMEILKERRLLNYFGYRHEK